jgi:hypothetical protein
MDQHLGRLGRLEWDTPFEVAGRINAWLWAHFLFLASPTLEPSHCTRFVSGLGLLAEYLHQTIEYHSSGNHLLLEAKALALCGEVFPEFAGASRWRQRGWRILEREVRKQICDDGVHAERSTMYHRIIAGELAELWLFCGGNQRRQAAGLEESVRRMAQFQSWIDHGGHGGDLPLFGDAHAEDTYYRFSAPAAVATAQGYVGQDLITESTDHSFWLLGRDRRGSLRPRPPQTAPTGRAFPEGGYFVARSTWTPDADVLVFDCGSTGYRLSRKHAHLDALSFTLSVAGTPVLIDPGVHDADCDRQSLRSTRAHSTVCIDGEEQGILAQRGEIWSPPRPELLLWATSEQCTVMSGRHDGYLRLRDPVWHSRTIVVMHGLYWLIVDSIEGSGEHLVEQRFQVVPGAQVTGRRNGGGVEVTKDGVSLSLCWPREAFAGPGDTENAPPQIRIEPSQAELHCGRPEPNWTVTAERRGQVPMSLALAASPAARDARVHWAGRAGPRGWLVVTGHGFEHRVHVASGAGGPTTVAGGWSTDAPVAILRFSERVEPQDLLLAGASRVWDANRTYPADAGKPSGVCGITRIALTPEGIPLL